MEFGQNLLKSTQACAHVSAAKTLNIQLQVSYIPFSSLRNVLYSARAIYPQIQIEFILFLQIFPEASSRPHSIFMLGSNYLLLYYVYSARVGRKGWSLWNSFTKEGALALIWLQVSQVYILYSFHLIRSLNYLDYIFHYILLIKLIK